MEEPKSGKGKEIPKRAGTVNKKYMTPAEDALLFRLKDKTTKSWSEIAAYFPNRKQASLQVRYYRGIKKRRDQKVKGSTNKPSVNKTSKSSQSTISSQRTISGSSARSHLSRKAKQTSRSAEKDPLPKFQDSPNSEYSAAKKALSELAPSLNLDPVLIPSGYRRGTVVNARDLKSSKNRKRKAFETELPEFEYTHKQKVIDTSKEKVDAKSNKRQRLEANKAQVVDNIPPISPPNQKTDSSKHTRSVTRKMAEQTTKNDVIRKPDLPDESVDKDATDRKEDCKKGKKAGNRGPTLPGPWTTGWVPVKPLSPSDPRYPGIVPKVFIHPPPGRVIEYNTRSASFRIRTRRPSDDLRIGSLVLQRGVPVYERTDPRHEEYEGNKEKAIEEAEKAAAPFGSSFKTTRTGIMSPIREQGSDEDTCSEDDDEDE